MQMYRVVPQLILVLFMYFWTIEIVCVLLCLTHHITRIVSHILEHVYVDSMLRIFRNKHLINITPWTQ